MTKRREYLYLIAICVLGALPMICFWLAVKLEDSTANPSWASRTLIACLIPSCWIQWLGLSLAIPYLFTL